MAAVLLILFGGLFGFNYFRKMQSAAAVAHYQPPPVPVAVSRAQRQDVPQSLDAIGSLEAVRQVKVAPEVAGRITALHFQPGTKVRAGQPLVQLNDAPERGDLQRLRAQAKLARINLDRARRLLNLAVSRSELDAKQAALDEIEADIAKTTALIAQKLVRAPFAGALGVRQVHLGQYLNPGDTIVTLTDLSALYVNLTLPEQTSAQLRADQPVQLTVDAYPERSFTARVIAIEPQIGADTRAIKLQARLDNTEGVLAPGMFAHARVLLPPRSGVITVPETAVDYTIHGDSVYVVSKQAQGALSAARVLVQTGGRIGGDRVIISKGVAPGDLVVTIGQLNLHDGAAVTLVKSSTLSDAASARSRGAPQ
jgi:multidrug efflux system membrane fusion protein